MFASRFSLARLVAVLLALASSARAQVLIDFESLPVGTVVTNQYPEVTFSSSAGNENQIGSLPTSGQFLCTAPIGGQVTCIEDTYLDFAGAASGLTILAVEANCLCVDARFRIFQNGVHTVTVDLFGLGGPGNVPVDLSAYPNITRLETVNILVDLSIENGIGWDDFSFSLETGNGFCAGDGTATACPCANSGAAGRGCSNSVNAAGARLSASGVASIGIDSLMLFGSGMPNSSALYFQGTGQVSGGMGVTFGDGLRCAGGTLLRLKIVSNTAGISQYPQAGDPSISVRGQITMPGSRSYQVWYRNAATFCTAQTFNLSNGWSVTWGL